MFTGEVKCTWGEISGDNANEEPSVMIAQKADESAELIALSPVVDYEM